MFATSAMDDPHAAPCDTFPFDFEQVMERSPWVEHQDTCFLLDAAYMADENEGQTLEEEGFRFMEDVYACEEAREAFVEDVSSLGMAAFAITNSWSASDSVIDMAFMESFCFDNRDDHDSMEADFLTTCDSDSTGPEQGLDFERIIMEQPSVTDFALDPGRKRSMRNFPVSVTWPIEQQAPCYFFANYVVEDTSNSRGYLNYLPSLCEREDTNGFVRKTVASLGLVGLAMRRRDSSIMNSAQLKYASALNQLNVALTSKEDAVTDQALTTVFLLGLYEASGGPEFLLEWSRESMHHETPDEFLATTSFLNAAKICSIRADMGYFRNYTKSAAAVPWALAIDADLVAWEEKCPAPHKFTTRASTGESEFLYEDYFHVYSSLATATIWNEHRKMRMLCHEIVLQHLPYLIEHTSHYPDVTLSQDQMETQIRESIEVIERVAKDICASVPFHFGLHLGMKPGLTTTLAPKAVCGNLLLRPLWMAGEPRFVSDGVRRWAIGRLKRIAEVMGIKQGTSLAHLIKIGVDPDQWEDTIRDY